MAGVNKVILVGNVGKDPDIVSFENNRKATFSIATSERYKDKKGETVEKTEWHNIVFWGPVVEVVEKYVKKGKQVYVEGKLSTRSYEKDGQTKYVTEVVGQNLTLLGGPAGGGGSQEQTQSTQSSHSDDSSGFVPPMTDNSASDDLPF